MPLSIKRFSSFPGVNDNDCCCFASEQIPRRDVVCGDIYQNENRPSDQDRGSAAQVLKFTYSTGDSLKWMQNFWLCKNESDFETCSGYVKNAASFVADRLNASIELVGDAFAEGTGVRLPNGTWTPGVTRDIIDGKADFGIGIRDLKKCLDTRCLDNILEARYCALVPLPRSKELFTAFTEPFSQSTWIVLLFSFFAMGIFLAKFKAEHYQDFTWLGLYATVIGQDYSGKMTTGYSVGGLDDSLFPQDGRRRRQALRLLPMTTWHLSITILYMSYSALVIKYFMNQLEGRLKNFGDLEKSYFNLTANPSVTDLLAILEVSNKPTLRSIKQKMSLLGNLGEDFYPSDDEAYIEGGAWLYLRLDNLRAKGDERWKHSYVVCETELLPPRYRMPYFNKGFRRIEEARRAVQEFVERGFSARLERAYLTPAAERMEENYKDLETNKVLKPVPLRNVYAWFLGLLVGSGASFFVLLCECFVHRLTNDEVEEIDEVEFGNFRF